MVYKASDLVLGALGVSVISNVVLSSKLKKAQKQVEVRDDCFEMMNRTMTHVMNDNEKLRVELKAAKKK